jgi:tetratricopeptide (TPR) repeat protein
MADAHYTLGVALEAQGRVVDAIRAFRAALSRESEMARAHRRLGTLLGNTEHVSEARRHLERAVALEPQSADGHHFLAVALHRLGETSKAMEHETRAIALAESSDSKELLGTAHYGLALMLQSEGRLDEAVQHLERALVYYPKDVDVLSELARAHHLLGHHEAAIALQKQVISARPKDAESQYRLGVFLAASGDFQRARRAFENSLRVAPDYAPAIEAIAKLDRTERGPG